MQAQLNLSDISVEQVVEHIFSSRRITRADQERFMATLWSKQMLTEAEQFHVNRVFDALRSGLIRVVD